MGANLGRCIDEPLTAGTLQSACEFCGHANPLRAKFCNECGAPRQLRPCWACDAVNALDAARCHSCGASLDDRGPVDFDAAEATLAVLLESQHSRPEAGIAVVHDDGIGPPNPTSPNAAAPGRPIVSPSQPSGRPSLLALAPGRRAVSYLLGSILIAAVFLALMGSREKTMQGSAYSFDGPVPTGAAAPASPAAGVPAPVEPPGQLPAAKPSRPARASLPANRTGDSKASPQRMPKTTSAGVARDRPAGASRPRTPAKAAPRNTVEPRARTANVVETRSERHVERARPEANRAKPPATSIYKRSPAPAEATPPCADPSSVLSGCIPGA